MTTVAPASQSTASLTPIRVLLVSSRVAQREALAQSLQQRGFCTLQAATDRDRDRLTELAPAAIVVDMAPAQRMSELNAQLWFTHERWSRFVPVILLADSPLAPAVEQAARASCYFVLSKSCAPDVLSDAVAALVAGHART